MASRYRLRYRAAGSNWLWLVVLGVCFWGEGAQQARAVPQFARRYNLKCSACHTIVPVLNEQGYLFKRLGYHLPPALVSGQPGSVMSYIVRSEPKWDLFNNLSVARKRPSYPG